LGRFKKCRSTLTTPCDSGSDSGEVTDTTTRTPRPSAPETGWDTVHATDSVPRLARLPGAPVSLAIPARPLSNYQFAVSFPRGGPTEALLDVPVMACGRWRATSCWPVLFFREHKLPTASHTANQLMGSGSVRNRDLLGAGREAAYPQCKEKAKRHRKMS
jgi:hypothetical protein